jgi:hypothetical protein
MTMDRQDPSLASPAPTESASELLAVLRRLYAEGKVEIRVEAKRLDHIDSPVAVQADGNIWVYAFVALALVVWWRAGMVPALIALTAGVIVYLTVGRAYIHRRIERRVRQDALNNVEKWRKLWRFSGLTLAATHERNLAPCTSPDGNWMAFVRALG